MAENTGNRFGRSAVIVILGLVAMLLQGCIPIVDLGEYWAKGTIDPRLAGDWRKMGVQYHAEASFMSFARSDDCYLNKLKGNGDPGSEAMPPIKTKTLTLGGHTFLMYGELDKTMTIMTPPGAPPPGKDALFQGGLRRYTMENGILSTYDLKDGVLVKAIQGGMAAGRIPKEDDPKTAGMPLPALARLDEKTAAFLIALADQPENWKEPQRYERVPDLEKAIESSLTYPATGDTPAHTLVKIELPDLKYLAEGRREVLQRQLEASPEWCVFQDRGGKLVCYQRTLKDGQWMATLNGFISGSHPDWLQTRAQFTFADTGKGFGGSNRSWLTEAGPMAGETHLGLQNTSQGIQSYLTIGQKGLWFEYFEESKTEDRAHTRTALAWLEWFLKGVRADEKEIESRGYAAALMPPDGVHHGSPQLEATDGMEGGIYDVRGWINPGKAGSVYLKAFDVETGARLSPDMTKDSNELTGWSRDSAELFYYNRGVLIGEGDPGRIYTARFEMWFRPDDGTAESKLVETMHKVRAFER